MTTRTVGNSGYDHTSLEDALGWFATNEWDFTVSGPHTIVVNDDLTVNANTVATLISSFTTSSSGYLIVQGQNSTVMTVEGSVPLALSTNSQRYGRLKGFIVRPAATFTGTQVFSPSYHTGMENIEFDNPDAVACSGAEGGITAASSVHTNCLARGFTSSGAYGFSVGAATCTNLTSYGNYRGFDTNASGVLTDCAFLENSNFDYDGQGAPTNIATSDATGTSGLINLVGTDQYTDPINGDFSFKVGNVLEGAGVSGNNIGYQAVAGGSSGTIIDINGTNSIQAGETGVVVNGTGFDAAPVTQTVSLTDGTNVEALTITDWNSGSPIVTVPTAIDLKWGSTTLTLQVTDDQGTSLLNNVTLTKRDGWNTINWTTTPSFSTTESFWEEAFKDFALIAGTGDQVAYTTDPSMVVDIETVPTINPPQTISGTYKVWDASSNTYTAETAYSIQENSSSPVVTLDAVTGTQIAPFVVNATISETVTDDTPVLNLSAGTAGVISGTGTTRQWTVTPPASSSGSISIYVEAGSFIDVDTNPSLQSNIINVSYNTTGNTPATGSPVIVGTAQQGVTLTLDISSISDADGLGTFSYQWYRDEALITGATSDSYLLQPSDVGAVLTVVISFTDGNGNPEEVSSSPTDVVIPSVTSPLDITLSNSSIVESAANGAIVGTLTVTDIDVGDTHTLTLVTGTGDDDNSSFSIAGNTLSCNTPSVLGEGTYSIRVQADDETSTPFQKQFTITLTAAVDSTREIVRDVIKEILEDILKTIV